MAKKRSGSRRKRAPKPRNVKASMKPVLKLVDDTLRAYRRQKPSKSKAPRKVRYVQNAIDTLKKFRKELYKPGVYCPQPFFDWDR